MGWHRISRRPFLAPPRHLDRVAGTRGLGALAGENFRARRFDLTTVEGWRAWAGAAWDDPIGAAKETWPPPIAPHPDDEKRLRLTAEVTLDLDGSVLIGSPGLTADAPDSVHLQSGGRSVVPGTSLAGVLRQRATRIANMVRQERGDGETFVEEMFGPIRADRAAGPLFASRLRVSRGADWIIRESERVLRVAHKDIPGFEYTPGPKYKPDWSFQNKACWVKFDEKSNVTKFEFEAQQGVDWREGTLVLTGSAPGDNEEKQKREFVFLQARADEAILIPENLWERFHDDDQISKWQRDAFPKSEPQGAQRRAAGHLRVGEPVFFVREGQELLFLGRAQLFRFPYDLSPADLVPQHLQTAGIDIAEAMFGCVAENGAGTTIKGRVRFEDAVATPRTDGFYEEIIVPRILSSPKVTAFQQYLVQDGTEPPRALKTYFRGEDTVIRGHKLYWHRWDEARGLEDVKEPVGHEQQRSLLMRGDPKASTQHTIVKPVRSGTLFRGRIRFDNLLSIELGALLSALRLPDGCAHKLGMAKPLGLGSVRIEASLNLIDRVRRYETWQDDGVDAAGAPEVFENAFADAIVAHAKASNEIPAGDGAGLWSIGRLDALRKMLTFDGRPSPLDTPYLKIQGGNASRFGRPNEFYDLPVLPTPHGVLKVADPWAGVPAPRRAPRPQQRPGGETETSPRQGATSRKEGGKSPLRSRQPATPRAGEPHAGQVVRCRLTSQKTKKGGSVLEIPALKVEAVLSPSSKALPDTLKEGDEIDLVIKATATRPLRFQVAYEPRSE